MTKIQVLTIAEDEQIVTLYRCPACGYHPGDDGACFGARCDDSGLTYTVCPECGADWPD